MLLHHQLNTLLVELLLQTPHIALGLVKSLLRTKHQQHDPQCPPGRTGLG
jgi:hypothetical protein